MGNINSCFDHEAVKKSSNQIEYCYNDAYLLSLSSSIPNIATNLSYLDETHDVLTNEIDTISGYATKISNYDNKLTTLKTALETSISSYKDAEGSMESFLPGLAKIIGTTLGNTVLQKKIEDGEVNKDTIANNKNDFLTGADAEVLDFITDYAKYVDKSFKNGYESEEDWKAKLVEFYENKGYSSYDAEELARTKMAKWRLEQTGATIAGTAIATHIDEFNELAAETAIEYKGLVSKYKEEGYTEQQAKELARAEAEMNDAKENSTNDNWDTRYSDAKKEYNKLVEKYNEENGTVVTDKKDSKTTDTVKSSNESNGSKSSNGSSSNSNSNSNSSNSTGGNSNSSSSSTGNGGSSIKNKVIEDTSKPSIDKNNSTEIGNSIEGTLKPVVDDKKPTGDSDSNITEDKPNTDTTPINPTPSNPDSNTTPSNPDSNTTPSNPNTNVPPTNTNNNNSNTNNSTNINTNPSGTNSNNYNNNYSSNSSSIPSNQQITSNDTNTTVGEIVDNSGESLIVTPSDTIGSSNNNDIISNDSISGSTPSLTTKTSGSNVIPIAIGIAAAGAAGVAGTRYIKNKNESKDDDNYEDDYDNKKENDFSYLNNYSVENEDNQKQTVDLFVETKEPKNVSNVKVPKENKSSKSGSINKLILESSDDIKISDKNAFKEIKEELE